MPHMNIHEYQAKKIFAEFGLPVSKGVVAQTPEEAEAAAQKLGGNRWVAKAQVHAGGRGKAGGVALLDSPEAIRDFAARWLGQRLVTYQTDEGGQPVNHILVEECTEIDRELYLGAAVDRSSRRVVFMASTEGGVEIEKVAAETPEKILRTAISPLSGALPFQGRSMAFGMALSAPQAIQFSKIFLALYRLFIERDLSLLEINPLVVTTQGNLHCLDAKLVADDNALYRQQALTAMRDASQEDEREARAAEWGLNYVALDGSIGCMVNGAGLAMGTMDLIQLHGGSPANFLDVGGGATSERVSEAFKIILSDSKVRAILINIFGGIVRCDLVAEGIVEAVKEAGVEVPVVVRLEGNNAPRGLEILAGSDFNIIAADTITEAAEQAVAAAAGKGAGK